MKKEIIQTRKRKPKSVKGKSSIGNQRHSDHGIHSSTHNKKLIVFLSTPLISLSKLFPWCSCFFLPFDLPSLIPICYALPGSSASANTSPSSVTTDTTPVLKTEPALSVHYSGQGMGSASQVRHPNSQIMAFFILNNKV